MFVAGEAGPEIVGHVGGRTEVLNASQLASVMHTAITDGMNQFVSWFQALNTNMVTCANGVIAAVSTAAAGAMGDLVAWADEKWH
ncbi:MAG: hypothetical protein LUH36_08490, partial [Oscillospiraceae bacterium]|nr:hypothetical protein [Oscillospiraceae bacterium]